jgi:hypothetical protein
LEEIRKIGDDEEIAEANFNIGVEYGSLGDLQQEK